MTEKKEKKEVLSLKKLHEWIKGNQTRHEKLVKQIDKNESYNSDRRCIIRDKIDATQVAIFIAFALIVGLIVWCLCLQLDGINKINDRIYPDGNTQPLVTKCQAKKIVKQNISKPFIDDYEDFMIVLRNSITSNDKSIIIGEGGLLKNTNGNYQYQSHGGAVREMCLTAKSDDTKLEALYKHFDLKYVKEKTNEETVEAHLEEGYEDPRRCYIISFSNFSSSDDVDSEE